MTDDGSPQSPLYQFAMDADKVLAILDELKYGPFVEPEWWVTYTTAGPLPVSAAMDVGEALYAPRRDQPPPMTEADQRGWMLSPGPPPPPMEGSCS